MIHVQFFGRFKMWNKDASMEDEVMRSDMLVKLLAYLILHRAISCSVQDLIEVLWAEEEIDNPAGALKNLMYRLRKNLKNCWPDLEFIQTKRGSYQWNPEIETWVDIEEFESSCMKYHQKASDRKSLEEMEDVLDLYQGKYMAGYSDEYWILSQQIYLHNLYLNTVKEVAADLYEAKKYSHLEKLCTKAIEQDSLDEEIHCWLLRAYLYENKRQRAREHYRETVTILYDNLGINPSEELQDIYHEMSGLLHEQEDDLSEIQKELIGDSQKGAFYCDYGVFRESYELEVRRARRMGMSAYLALVTLQREDGEQMDEKTYLTLMSDGMEQMQEVLLGSLRSGDVITRYSLNQFLVMLPGCQYENAQMVLERIRKKYFDNRKHAKIEIQFSLNELNIA